MDILMFEMKFKDIVKELNKDEEVLVYNSIDEEFFTVERIYEEENKVIIEV